MYKPILISTNNPIKLGSVCKDSTFGLGTIINKYGEDCFYNTHKSGGSITTPWKRNLEGRLTNYDIIIVDTETEISINDWYYDCESKTVLQCDVDHIKAESCSKVLSTISKEVDLPQLSNTSKQLLFDYYNEHGEMPESVDIEEEEDLIKVYDNVGAHNGGTGKLIQKQMDENSNVINKVK